MCRLEMVWAWVWVRERHCLSCAHQVGSRTDSISSSVGCDLLRLR